MFSRRIIFLLLAATFSMAIGQQTPPARQAELRQRGTNALDREHERRRNGICVNQQALATCLAAESKVTEENYLAYVRAIGGLFRMVTMDAPPPPGGHVARVPFDESEFTWQHYRDQSCSALAQQWHDQRAQVAEQGCRITLMQNHMDELASLYAGLWK